MRVKEIMKSAKTIQVDSSVNDAAKKMSESRIGSLIVMDEKNMVGIVTERDIMSKVTAMNKLPSSVKIESIMTPKVLTIGPNNHIDDAIYIFIKHKIKKLPVVDHDELVGVITSTDIVANSDEIGQFYFFG